MNSHIPSFNYYSLDKTLPLETILDNFYNQINILKSYPLFNNENVNFELEFRLREQWVPINFGNILNSRSCQYQEYLYYDSKNTKYRIICNSEYPNSKQNSDPEETKNSTDEYKFLDDSNIYNYIKSNADKEITESLIGKTEYTRKVKLMTAYYFIYKIVLSIETTLNTEEIEQYIRRSSENDKTDEPLIIQSIKGPEKEMAILNFFTPDIKKRRSFLMHNDIRIDITSYDERNQLEIDFTKNIYHDRNDMIHVVHEVMLALDCSKFILDYLFRLLPNFEFQKPITPTIDVLFRNAENMIKNYFYVSAKTDGLRTLIFIINNLMFSIAENFAVKFVGYTNTSSDPRNIVLDCEYVNDVYVPFDIVYNDGDLREKCYMERLENIKSLNVNGISDILKIKNIQLCKSFPDVQKFVNSEINGNGENKIPNDGVILTDGQSTYNDNLKIYKIKTMNTVDLQFNGRLFFAKQKRISKKFLNLSLSEYKKICLMYHQHKKENDKKDEFFYYKKQVFTIKENTYSRREVTYHLVREKKKPFIIEINLDTKKVEKVRKDKAEANSFNTFKSVLLATFQKINIDIFSPSSNLLMRRYHNMIKRNILSKYKGKLLDIGSGNGGDINKWNNFKKIVCVEPDPTNIKIFKKRVSRSEVRKRVSIIQSNIEDIELEETFDIATCFFVLNNLTYSAVSEMLNNIHEKIKGIFAIIFRDYSLFRENIETESIVYKQCVDSDTGCFNSNIDKNSSTYLLSSLRLAHGECENIMYINVANSHMVNSYENAIDCNKIIELFNRYGFSIINNNMMDSFHFLNSSQLLYSSFIRIIEFSNIN